MPFCDTFRTGDTRDWWLDNRPSTWSSRGGVMIHTDEGSRLANKPLKAEAYFI